MNIRAKYGCKIVGIQRGKEIIVTPPAEEVILRGDVLIVMGHNNGIGRFERHGV